MACFQAETFLQVTLKVTRKRASTFLYQITQDQAQVGSIFINFLEN